MLQVQDFLNGLTVEGGIGEYGPDEHVSPPERVADALAAAEVRDVEPQVAEPIVRLEQREVGVISIKLQTTKYG